MVIKVKPFFKVWILYMLGRISDHLRKLNYLKKVNQNKILKIIL